jgi:hypothetical protein
MEHVDNDDLQLSADNSHFRPKTRNKLSSKHRVKLKREKEDDIEVLFSPVSHCFKRYLFLFLFLCNCLFIRWEKIIGSKRLYNI